MNDSSDIDQRPPRWAKFLIDLLTTMIVLAIGVWAASKSLQKAPAVAGGNFVAPKAMEPCVLNTAGYLNGRLYGALERKIDWRGAEMVCDGMRRPNNDGIRLFFALSDTRNRTRVIFVIGIDGEIDELTRNEEKANITIIDGESGRFFSTSGQERCWTTVRSIERLSDKRRESYQVSGDLYCAGALPSITDKGSVTLGDFRYSGRLILDDS